MESQNNLELTVELRKSVVRECEENKNLKDRNQLLREIYLSIPEHWRKSVGFIKVVVFKGPINKRLNIDIKELESRALAGKEMVWSDDLFKPEFGKLVWLADSKNRIIYLRSYDSGGYWRDDYDIKRDFLTAFGVLIWGAKKDSRFQEFCEKELVVDYPNFFLGHVLSEKEVADCYPKMSLQKIRQNLKIIRGRVARDNFSRLWQLSISSPEYLQRKMTKLMVMKMERLDKLVALGKL